VFLPRRVPISVSNRLPATELAWMFPDSSYSRAVRLNRAAGGPRRQRSIEQRAADTHVRQSPTSDTEQSTPLERLVKTISAGISKVLQP
jgi:hypothetical protein